MRSRLFCHYCSIDPELYRPDPERRRIGERARRRVLSAHTSEHRAAELEGVVDEARAARTAVA